MEDKDQVDIALIERNGVMEFEYDCGMFKCDRIICVYIWLNYVILYSLTLESGNLT